MSTFLSLYPIQTTLTPLLLMLEILVESLSTIHQRFMKQVANIVPAEIAEHVDGERWIEAQTEIEGCARAKGVHRDTPSQFSVIYG